MRSVRSYEASASIQAPLQSVWERLSDVLHWNRWTPTVDRIEALDGGELARAHRFRVHQPKLRPAIWQVTLVEAPSRFTWESRSPGVRMVAEHILDERAPGHTQLVLRFSFGGVLGSLVDRFYGKLVASYIATEAASLRRRVEADLARDPGAA